MKRIITILIMTAVCTSTAFAAGNAADGEGKVAICAACHGADGNSAAPNFPKLAGQNEKYLIKQLQDIKGGTRAVPEMLGFMPMLQPQDIEDIAAFYASQTATIGQANPDLVALGKKLYMGGNLETGVTACAACHSPTGSGNSAAGFPSLSGQHAAYTALQLNKFRLGARNEGEAVPENRTNDNERIMRDNAFKLKDFEIEALASYISGLH